MTSLLRCGRGPRRERVAEEGSTPEGGESGERIWPRCANIPGRACAAWGTRTSWRPWRSCRWIALRTGSCSKHECLIRRLKGRHLEIGVSKFVDRGIKKTKIFGEHMMSRQGVVKYDGEPLLDYAPQIVDLVLSAARNYTVQELAV